MNGCCRQFHFKSQDGQTAAILIGLNQGLCMLLNVTKKV
jgi:hypothetical protein